jgi:hypothetical protein
MNIRTIPHIDNQCKCALVFLSDAAEAAIRAHLRVRKNMDDALFVHSDKETKNLERKVEKALRPKRNKD